MVASNTALGIRLIVRIGDTLMTPPRELLDAITNVQVTNESSGQDGFSISFTLTRQYLDYNLLASGLLDAPTRIALGVMIGVLPEVLIDGVITHHQLTPSADPGASTLTVTGRDFSEAMNFDEQREQFGNQSDDVIFGRVMQRYSRFGVTTVAQSSISGTPTVNDRIPAQTWTDLAFVRHLASRNGFLFYVEPITLGRNLAYFGLPNRVGVPQPALTFNMGAASNLTSIDFSHDPLAESAPAGKFLERNSNTVLPIPPVTPPRLPPLARQRSVHRTTIMSDTAKLQPAEAGARLISAIMNAPDPVQANGQIDTARYGAVLRARKLVGVRGVGSRFDGLYYVRRVTHAITRSDYTQQFGLSREGLHSTVPAVPS